MGKEAACTVRFGRESSPGKARLETRTLEFRGAFDLDVPLDAIASAEAEGGALHVRWPGGEAAFELGRDAEKWALAIRHPKGRLDKLGIKPDLRVAVLGLADEAFLRELGTRTADVSVGRARKDTDVIFLGAGERAALEKLAGLERYLKRNGAIWVVRPKGRKEITERDVMESGKAAGLVDVKVVAFSDTHTAEKLVIPVARR